MTIHTLPAIHDGLPIDIIIIGGERWIRSSQIGLALGFAFAQPSMNRLFKRNSHEFGPDDTMVVELRTAGGLQLTRLFSDKGIAKIAMLASTPRAAAFRDWAATVLTTPKPEPELLLAAPALTLSGAAKQELVRAWHKGKNRDFVRYARGGLTSSEICKLTGWATRGTVSKKRRTAEALGLLEPGPALAHGRRSASQNLLPYRFQAKGGTSNAA
jgi:hypothetical protein